MNTRYMSLGHAKNKAEAEEEKTLTQMMIKKKKKKKKKKRGASRLGLTRDVSTIPTDEKDITPIAQPESALR